MSPSRRSHDAHSEEWDGTERRRDPRAPVVNVYPNIHIEAPKWTLGHLLTALVLLGALAGFLLHNENRTSRMEATLAEVNALVKAHVFTPGTTPNGVRETP